MTLHASPSDASPYVGRFAPSPTGPLHAGSLVAALASWLDARAHAGRWLVRIEDLDRDRCRTGAAERILQQLDALGLRADEPPLWQSDRLEGYRLALDQLVRRELAYPCACTRADIDAALRAQAEGAPHERHTERIYPGTCRPERGGLGGRAARAWRVRSDAWPGATAGPRAPAPDAGANADRSIVWHDRARGERRQDVSSEVGDFVLKRADGVWSYQLAVVVDDAAQGVTCVVRGSDLLDNTPRQILLQHLLGLPTPSYLHTPLVLAPDGEKLSKQHGAPEVDVSQPLAALRAAGAVLGLDLTAARSVDSALGDGIAQWRRAWAPPA